MAMIFFFRLGCKNAFGSVSSLFIVTVLGCCNSEWGKYYGEIAG
jgi:hypothetical protein